jgi:hypothetical protein
MSAATVAMATVALIAQAQQDSCARPVQFRLHEQPIALVRGLDELNATRPHFFLPAAVPIRVCSDNSPVLSRWSVPDIQRRLYVAPLELRVLRNSAYPRTVNDGAVWAGVGTSLSATAGFELSWRWLTLGIKPIVTWQENADFDFATSPFPDHSTFAHPDHYGIDYPSRFGDHSFSEIDAGQSFLRFDVGPVSAAFSHENLLLGASDIYPILLSTTAPGFWHLRLGTRRPVDLRVARLDLHTFWGSVDESDYFDGDSDNDSHLFVGVVASIEPSFVPGLRIGAARIAHLVESAGGHDLGFYLRRLIDTPIAYQIDENLPENAIAGLFGSWTIAEGDFEVHAEWTREDRPFNLEDVLREPDWTQAYSLGFGKTFRSAGSLARFSGELVHLGESAPVRAGKGSFTYYTHTQPPQGHTHRGQILGAAVGPGSDAQTLAFDLFRETSMYGISIERARYDDDTYYRQFARRYGEARHDVELTGQVRAGRWLGPLQLQAALSASRRYDRSFLVLREGVTAKQIETNWGLDLRLSWQPIRQ